MEKSRRDGETEESYRTGGTRKERELGSVINCLLFKVGIMIKKSRLLLPLHNILSISRTTHLYCNKKISFKITNIMVVNILSISMLIFLLHIVVTHTIVCVWCRPIRENKDSKTK